MNTEDAFIDWEVENVRELAGDFETIRTLIGKRFSRSEARDRALTFLRCLIGPTERRNGWQMAEMAGDATPYAMQHLLGRAVWSADDVRDDLRDYVCTHLGDPTGVLIVDETGFLKKGDKSAGVRRQYSGTAGRIENCQIGVFLAYVAPRGRVLLDRELYLPKEWADDAERCRTAGVPAETGFATKLQLGRRMIDRARRAGVPFQWVTADAVYGSASDFRRWLETHGFSFVLAVTAQYRVWWNGSRQWASEIVTRLPERDWTRLSAGTGTKGERTSDWARIQLGEVGDGRCRWLLFRRSIGSSKELAYYICSAPISTSLTQLVRVAGTRWAIEECFESAKGEVGLDQYEVRSWVGWYRHITLAMLAHAYLTVMRTGRESNPVAGAQKKIRIRRRRKT